MDRVDRACIIGAGSSGIAACQALQARGIPFDCFEAGSQIGGNWRYLNDNGMSSAYRSLHINSSRQSMQYRAWPMPDHYPPYVSHRLAVQYFDDYVAHFGFADRIQFRTTVTRVSPAEDGTWDVTTTDRDGGEETTTRYGAVLVANGHHWDPRFPSPAFPGADSFTGRQLHSHHYRTPELLTGKRVLVVGIGNSATDIAVESSTVAARTLLSVRRGAHVVPKFILGVPTDHLTLSWASAMLPLRLQSRVLGTLLRLSQGRMSSYGLPEPDHRVLHAHPTASDTLLSKLGHGDIEVRPTIERFDGDRVRFVDGSVEDVDVVVYCTGYHITFPFLSSQVIDTADNRVSLYRRVVPPGWPNLYFIGLVQPIGAIMPMAEAQAQWVADLLQGRAALPTPSVMQREIHRYQLSLANRYVRSHRHTIQVDFRHHLRDLARERRAGAQRASRPDGITRPLRSATGPDAARAR